MGPGEPPEGFDPDMVIDLDGRVVMPAFVDCHTHACWSGSRLDGISTDAWQASYLDVLAAGGGILSTVRAVRKASSDELLEGLAERLAHVASWGTGTIEIKSGYGLDTETELKMLRAIHDVSQQTSMLIAGTFLAHAIDPDVPDFVDRMIQETLPAVAEEFPGITCDAYCEEGAWSVEDTVRLFERARELGCPIRVHTDQFNDLGMTERAIELGAVSVDHLEASGPDTVSRIGDSDTIAVLLPAVDSVSTIDMQTVGARGSRCRGRHRHKSEPRIGSVSVDADGHHSCLPQVRAHAAAGDCGGYMANAACVLGLQDQVGSIAVGNRADLVVLDSRDEREIAWWVSAPPPPLILHKEVIRSLANRTSVEDMNDEDAGGVDE